MTKPLAPPQDYLACIAAAREAYEAELTVARRIRDDVKNKADRDFRAAQADAAAREKKSVADALRHRKPFTRPRHTAHSSSKKPTETARA